MNKVILVSALSCFLAGCATPTTTITHTKNEVIMPPEAMFNCPSPASLPNPDTLTDVEVSRLVVQLWQDNKTCVASMKSLHAFLVNAHGIVKPGIARQVLKKLKTPTS